MQRVTARSDREGAHGEIKKSANRNHTCWRNDISRVVNGRVNLLGAAQPAHAAAAGGHTVEMCLANCECGTRCSLRSVPGHNVAIAPGGC